MDTLVLDVGYQPIDGVTWQDAICWVLDKVVEVVDEYPDKYIRTPSWKVNMPSVVRFLKPIKRKTAIKFSRHNVYLRDNGKCQYCGNHIALNNFTYEHVVPRAQGGKTCWENVVVACVPCNQQKAGRTPEQAGMRLRSNPVRPKKLPYRSHFNLVYRPGMPEAWRTWLRDAVYWESELENDNRAD